MAINKWKLIAIIFIILFIVETLSLLYILKVGINSINNKIKCQTEICFNQNSDYYTFDDVQNLCECYIGTEVIYREYLK